MTPYDKPSKLGPSRDLIVFYIGTTLAAMLLIFMFVSFALGIWFEDSRWASTAFLSLFAAFVVFAGGLGIAYLIEPEETQ